MYRNSLKRALVLMLTGTLMTAGIVLADDATLDGDEAVPLNKDGSDLVLSTTVCEDEQDTGSPLLFLKRAGNSATNTAKNDSTLTGSVLSTAIVAAGTTSVGSSLSASITSVPATIAVPSGWESAANGTLSDHLISLVTFTAGGAGTFVGTVNYRLAGTNRNNVANNWDQSMTVTATVIECDDPPPPPNNAPEVSAVFNPSTIDCRDGSDLEITFTDADSTSWSAEIDWEYDGLNFINDETVDPVTSGALVPHTYNTPGLYTAAVRVTDNQGATSDVATAGITVNQTYTVAFLNPLDGSTSPAVVKNTFKNGRVVPVKATIYDDCAEAAIDGSSTIIPNVKLQLVPVTVNGLNADVEYADAGQSSGNSPYMRWADGFWIYNLDSKALKLTTNAGYRLDIFLGTAQVTTEQWVLLQPTK